MEEKKIDNTKSKLYVLCSDILNPVYATVQGSHAVAQYLIEEYYDNNKCWKNDTVVFLYYPHKLLQTYAKEHFFVHPKITQLCSIWFEPDMNNACTAIAIWNKDLQDYEATLDDNDKYVVTIAQDVLDSLSVVSKRAYEETITKISTIRVVKRYDHRGLMTTCQVIVVGKNGGIYETILDRPFEKYHFYEIRNDIELKYAVHFDEEQFYSKMEEGNIIDNGEEN